MASQFRNIPLPPKKKIINFLLKLTVQKSLIGVGQTFVREDNVTPVTSHYRSP